MPRERAIGILKLQPSQGPGCKGNREHIREKSNAGEDDPFQDPFVILPDLPEQEEHGRKKRWQGGRDEQYDDRESGKW